MNTTPTPNTAPEPAASAGPDCAQSTGSVKWVIECESADRPGEWGQLEYPRSEERAHTLMAEWREWLDKNTRTWRAVRLVKVVTTREIVSSPNDEGVPHRPAN